LFQARRYLNAWSRHHRSGGFGIHSPYAYQFVRNVWRKRLPYYAYDGLRQLIGTIKDGTWYYMLPRLNVATGAAFKVWAPLNFSKHLTLFTNRCTRAAANNQRGFASDPAGYAPYMIVNETEAVLAAVASQELHAHPHSGVCPTLRFRPPEGGYYSASVVVRDVGLNTQDPNANGVWVALNVADHVVDSAYVSLESFSSTARLTFDKRLVAAGEPIDVCLVGDALHDKEVADALGIRCVLCAQGSHAAWRLRAVAPTGDTLLEAVDLALADAARRAI
jgi:hypothetical protein